MSPSISTGYIPPPPPRETPENFFERANQANFCLIPCPGAKNEGRIPGGRAKFSLTRINCSLSLQKILKKLRKLGESTNVSFGELNKTSIF